MPFASLHVPFRISSSSSWSCNKWKRNKKGIKVFWSFLFPVPSHISFSLSVIVPVFLLFPPLSSPGFQFSDVFLLFIIPGRVLSPCLIHFFPLPARPSLSLCSLSLRHWFLASPPLYTNTAHPLTLFFRVTKAYQSGSLAASPLMVWIQGRRTS